MPGEKTVVVIIELSERDAEAIEVWLEDCSSSNGSHGKLKSIKAVAQMLLTDVALVVRRPGSWEGSSMQDILASHGYRR